MDPTIGITDFAGSLTTVRANDLLTGNCSAFVVSLDNYRSRDLVLTLCVGEELVTACNRAGVVGLIAVALALNCVNTCVLYSLVSVVKHGDLIGHCCAAKGNSYGLNTRILSSEYIAVKISGEVGVDLGFTVVRSCALYLGSDSKTKTLCTEGITCREYKLFSGSLDIKRSDIVLYAEVAVYCHNGFGLNVVSYCDPTVVTLSCAGGNAVLYSCSSACGNKDGSATCIGCAVNLTEGNGDILGAVVSDDRDNTSAVLSYGNLNVLCKILVIPECGRSICGCACREGKLGCKNTILVVADLIADIVCAVYSA